MKTFLFSAAALTVSVLSVSVSHAKDSPFVTPDAAPSPASAAVSEHKSVASQLPQSWPGTKSDENTYADCVADPKIMTIQFEGVEYCDKAAAKCGLENGTPAALFGSYVNCKNSDKMYKAIESFILCEEVEQTDAQVFGNAAVKNGALEQCKPLLEGNAQFDFEEKSE